MKYLKIIGNMLVGIFQYGLFFLLAALLAALLASLVTCPTKAEAGQKSRSNYERQAFKMAMNYALSEWPDYKFTNRNIKYVSVWYTWAQVCEPGAAACYIPMFQTIMISPGYYPHVLMHEYLHHILFINGHPLAGKYHLPPERHENEHLRNGLAGRRIY